MPIETARIFEDIILRLSVLRYIFKSRSKIGLYDLNKHAENFIKNLLNLIEGWELVNLNYETKNFAVLDLGDDNRRICVQVTASNAGSKIYSTVSGFFERGLSSRYDRLIVIILTDKKNYTKGDYDGEFKFIKDRDIWDIDDILGNIEKLDLMEMRGVQDFLAQELAPIVQVLAPRESIFFDVEKMIDQPPQTCRAFLLSTGCFDSGSEEWDAEFLAINNFYELISGFSEKLRTYIAYVVIKGKILLRHGDPTLVIHFDEIQRILNLTKIENFNFFKILIDNNIATTDDEFYYGRIGLYYAPNDFDFFPALKKFCISDDMVKRIIVNGEFTLLDN